MITKPKKERIPCCIGNNLKLVRKRLGYSLDDVAYASGCSKAYLSQLENGQTKDRTSIEIAYNLYRVLKDEINVSFESFCMKKISAKQKSQLSGE